MKRNFASKIFSGLLAGALAFTSCLAEYVPVFAEQSVSTGGTVYFSVSDDDAYVISDTEENEGTVMAYIPVSIDAIAQEIDLEDYGYLDFAYDEDDDGQYETSLLQGFLYVLEHYYSGGTSELNITGSSGSTYMQNGFWGHDENLTYYVNGAYPLESEAWGATSDHIVLHDGDFIDVSMYTDWDFYTDSEAGYHFFADAAGEITHEYQATAGQPLQVNYTRTATDWNGTYETSLTACEGEIYWGTELYGEDASAEETEDGAAEITFPAAGTYYLWTYGAEGASGAIVSSPAYAKVTVAAAENPEEPDPEREEITAELNIICQSDNVFLAPAETVTVSSLEAENYGYTDEVEGISALDALVKAHEVIFGEDFTAETAGDFLAVSSFGFVTTLFGEATSANGFLVNEGYPNDGTESDWGGYNGTTVTTTEVAAGDKVDFFTYGDRSYYSDYYTFTEVPESVEAGTDFDVTVSGTMVMMGYSYADSEEFRDAAEPLEDAALAWVDPYTGEVLPIVYTEDEEPVVTDENGTATITAPEEPGLYYLTAISNEDAMVSVLMNMATVTVTEPSIPAVTAEVTIRSQMENVYLAPIDTAVEVSSDLAESYGYTDSVVGEVSALDALVKAHEEIFGEDFTAETAEEFLAVGSSGFVTKIFGEETSANGFLVNGGYPNDGTESPWGGYNGTTVSTTPLENGDLVDFFTYGDTSYWSDTFTYTEVPESVPAGTDFDVTVSGTMVMMGYMYADAEDFSDAAEALAGAALAWVDPSTGEVFPIVYAEDEEPVVTDEDGTATITAPEEPGLYYLTALSNAEEDVYALLNPAALTVDEAPAPAEEVTATIKINTPSDSAALYALDDEEKEKDLFAEVTPEGTAYTVTVEAGQYLLEVFSGDVSNGTIVLTVDSENTAFEVFTVTAYCTTSGFVYGTDYTIEKLQVLSGGDKATVLRQVTMGDSTTVGGKTFPVLMGDTYSFYGTPTEARAETYVPTYKTGTVTATNYTTASFTMATKSGLTVTVPYADTDADGENDYILEVGQMTNYYIYTYLDPTADTVDEEAATETQTFETAKSGAYFYRVTNPLNEDAVTYGNYITCSADSNTATVTTADMKVGDSSLDSSTVIKGFTQNTYDTGDIYMNINEKGYLNMASGSSYNLYPFRNWLAIEGISNAKVIEPDFHVEVIGDAVSVREKTENDASKHSFVLTADHAGTAIVLVTYDAMYDAVAMGSKPVFSAIWPENTGVFVVTVDGADGIDTGMTINKGLNTTKVSGDAYDADLDVLYYTGDAGAEYTFTPEAGTQVTMAVGQIAGGKLTFGDFTSEGVTMNADGSVTLSGMTTGKTIVKLTNGGRTEYQVLKTCKLSYTITNQEGAQVGSDAGIAEGAVIRANDTLTIRFDTVYIPANKLSGIYNMSGSIRLFGEDGTSFSGTANQYLFASTPAAQTVTVKVPKFWTGETYNLSGLVYENGFGSPYGTHRMLTYEAGKAPNFTAVLCAGSFGSLPEIRLPIQPTEFLHGAFTFADEKGNALPANTGTILLKDYENAPVTVTEEGSFQATAGTYSYTVNAAGYEYAYGTITLTEDGENVFEITLQTSSEGAWDGAAMTAPEQDEDGTYLIGTGAELKWFQNEVTVNKNKNINAVLTADINLAKYPWTPIGSTSYQMAGTFDGAGHEISNMYCTGSSALALFGCITGTVKDLTVSGDVIGTGGTLAGVVGYAQGQNASNPCVISNVVNNVNVTQDNPSATSASIAGIAGYTYYATIENCVNNGTITTNSTTVSASGYGGIVGYMMNYQPTSVTGCKNTGNVSGRKNVGGIVGYTGGSKPVISSCYNTGDIYGAVNAGGIAGDLQGAAFISGYNIGKITSDTDTGAQPIAGDSKSGFNVADAYYLDGCFEGTAACGTSRSEEALAGTSMDGFGTCCEGMPALLWENAQFHQKGEAVVTAPDCTEGGYTTYTCPICEKTFTDDYVPANGHSPVITDQHVGVGYGTCSVCGADLTVWDDERLAVLDYDEAAVSAISIEDTTAYPWTANSTGLVSGNKGIDSSTSETEISFTLRTAAEVSFEYRVSSEARYDKLTVKLLKGEEETTLANAISGSENGSFAEELAAGNYKLILSYYKDSSSASGEDLGEIKNFTIAGNTALEIIEQPQNIASAMAGDTLSYHVTAKNATVYLWQYSKDGENWHNSSLSKALTDTITMKAAPVNLGNRYRCMITGADGTVVYTDVVGVETVQNFRITEQPVNWDAADGKDAVFTVAAENAAGYQWQYSKDGGASWKKSTLAGSTTESIGLKISSSNMTNQYRCRVIAENGSVLYTETVGITGVPVITEQPQSWSLTDGTSVTFGISAENAESYQWYYSKDGGANWKKSTLSTAGTSEVHMKYAPANAANLYRCKVTGAGGIYVYSDIVEIIAE